MRANCRGVQPCLSTCIYLLIQFIPVCIVLLLSQFPLLMSSTGQHKRGCQWPLSKTSALPVSLLSLEIGPDTCLTCGARATLTRECCPCMVTSMPSSRVALVMSSIWRLQMSKMPFVPGKVCRVRAESAARSLSMIVGVMAVRRQR